MPLLEDFMESLTKEKYNLVKMGTIKSNKDKSLSTIFSNPSKGNKKCKDSKQQRVKEKKHLDTEISSSTDEDSKSRRMKSERE